MYINKGLIIAPPVSPNKIPPNPIHSPIDDKNRHLFNVNLIFPEVKSSSASRCLTSDCFIKRKDIKTEQII